MIEARTAGVPRVVTGPRTGRWFGWGLAGLGAVGVGLGLRQWIPSHDAGPSICLLRQVAHVACPTCGLTRSLASLARGEWGAAMTLHPFGVLLVAQLAAGWLLWGVAVARGRPVLSGRTAFRILLANGGTLLALWLVRLVTGTLPA